MPERAVVTPEALSEVRDTLKRIEQGVNVVAWRLGQFEEVIAIMDLKFGELESLDKWMRDIATAVGVNPPQSRRA